MIVESIQLQIMVTLLARGLQTRYGKRNHFEDVHSYEDFRNIIPLSFYDDLESDIEAVKSGEPDVLWPGSTNKFAVSSGTTGEGKHLPLSRERLVSDRKFMRRVTASYLNKHPNLFRLWGKHVSLPGSVEQNGNILIGEISGFSAQNTPFWLRPFQLVNPQKLTALPFKEKFEQVVERSIGSNVKVIVAVPSWILTLFQRVLQKAGKKTISEVWPNLNLLVCGGVKLSNYRSHLVELAGDLNLDFIETYGSSEGYFAYSDDPDKNDLKLVYDNGIFYEFIPNPLPDPKSLSIQDTIPLWEVEQDTPYALVATTNAGLWRYPVNDIVEVTSVNPPRIKVCGRLNEMLDDFGEALYVFEAEKALESAAASIDQKPGNFTIGGRLSSSDSVPRHHWFVQFNEPVHTQTLDRLASHLDRQIQSMNRHYAIRRESGALDAPSVHSITQTDINRWLEMNDQRKAQGKLPKMLQSKADVEFFLGS